MQVDEVIRRMRAVGSSFAYPPNSDEVSYARATIPVFTSARASRTKNNDFGGAPEFKFEFLDNKVISIKLIYDDTVKWNNADEFYAAVADGLHIPAQTYQHPTLDSQLLKEGRQ